jgi:hypothetical protein
LDGRFWLIIGGVGHGDEGNRGGRLTGRARFECTRLRAALLGREDEADVIKVVFQVDRCLNISELELCVDFTCHFEFGADVEDSMIQSISMDVSPVREVSESAYPGIERPGMPIWKSGMLPELTFPVTLAVMLKFASMVPPSPKQRFWRVNRLRLGLAYSI